MDICLAAFFLILALGIIFWSALNRDGGQTLRISCDGQTVEEVSLAQIRQRKAAEKDSGAVCYCLFLYSEEGISGRWYEESPDLAAAVPEGSSYNLMAVSGTHVWMEAADCRDQICVRHIPVADGGESIICLPHKLVAEIVGGADKEILYEGTLGELRY